MISCGLLAYCITMLVNLARNWSGLCDGGQCLESVQVGSLCSSSVNVDIQFILDWQPWAAIVIDPIALEILSDGSLVPLAHASFHGPMMLRGGLHRYRLNTCVRVAHPSALRCPS